MPKLRLYQQIVIFFVVAVMIPLISISFIIHSVNQKALKKEIARFTEHTAEALYKDFSTEMSWQRQQSQTMAKLLLESLSRKQSFPEAASTIFRLSEDFDAVGLYDEQGNVIQTAYQDFSNMSPELRLPDNVKEKALKSPYEVLYFSTGSPQESPYFLRVILPVEEAAKDGINVLPLSVTEQPGVVKKPAYYVQQKSFGYLQNLVRTNKSLYDAFYIIDNAGFIIAGPAGQQQNRINEEDYLAFARVSPGVTHEFSSPQTGKNDENQSLRKVVVKMPDINWGIVIESPYHVKQKHIKRAGTQTIIMIGGSLLLIMILTLVYVLGINRNFRQLIKGIKAYGEGNYYRRIRLITNFFTPFEIVYLTLEFNRMARKTADSWLQIKTLNEELLEANNKLAKLDELKSNLIDTVSHELRTPLTSIKGYTSRLIRYDSSLEPEARLKSLKVVKQQADRLGRLVEDLLVIPDLEKANLRVFPDQVQLEPLIESSVQFIQAKDQREVVVHWSCDPEEPVLADQDRLEQILLNLLDNAVKYSLPETPIAVSLAAETDSDDLPRVKISVINQCDTAKFEQLDNLESLFEKFKRMDDSLIRTTRGSGLGLFITKGLVEAMGGTIELQQRSGEFEASFTVPVYRDATEANALAELA